MSSNYLNSDRAARAYLNSVCSIFSAFSAKAILILLLGFFIANSNINASIRYVKTSGSGDGSTWVNASNSIQTMIDNSSQGDSVFVASGTYNLPATINWNKAISLFGSFNSTILAVELNKLWSNPQFNPNYSVLIDIRKAKFHGDSKEFPDFLTIFNAMPGNRTNRKFAVLTETPQQVAYSTMFGQHIKMNFPLSVEVFSTSDGALTWLGA